MITGLLLPVQQQQPFLQCSWSLRQSLSQGACGKAGLPVLRPCQICELSLQWLPPAGLTRGLHHAMDMSVHVPWAAKHATLCRKRAGRDASPSAMQPALPPHMPNMLQPTSAAHWRDALLAAALHLCLRPDGHRPIGPAARLVGGSSDLSSTSSRRTCGMLLLLL